MIRTNKIFLITDTFPFGNSEQFLETELKVLSQYTDHLIIVPRKMTDRTRKVPKNVGIDLSYARLIKNRFIIISILFSQENLSLILKSLNTIQLNIKNIIELVKYIYQAIVLRKWIEKKNLNKESSCILYTYWFDHGTFGCCLAKASSNNLSVITRAHRYDIYEEMGYTGTKLFREKQLSMIDNVFSVSEDGANYLKNKYSKYSDKILVSRLGVLEPGFTVRASSNNKLHVVSCSFVIEIKRVDLIRKSLQKFAELNPSIEVQWTHIGDGPRLAEIKREVKPTSNFTCKFLGSIRNFEVIEFYKANRIDLFINLSLSEGVPVSIMEAQSCGIPTIATDVGGTSEIVNNENGFLLSKDVTNDTVVRLLNNLNKDVLKGKAWKSKENWQNLYNANINYKAFFHCLKSLTN